MEAVASKQSWIFSSKQIRDKVDKAKWNFRLICYIFIKQRYLYIIS
jgi:hypothetical protein